MRIIQKKISDLIPYENNPRKNERAIDKVAASIKEFGFKVPIIIDQDNVIVAGHTRLKAAELLGLDKIPCIVADDLSDEQLKAFRLADNKTGEFAEWDFELLAEELQDITDIDMSEFGFDMSVVEDEEPETKQDIPPQTASSRCQIGDVWKMGGHRLICGDSTDPEVIDRLMDGEKADMVFTDPPYGVSYTGGMKIENGRIESNRKNQIKNDALDYDQFYAFLYDTFKNILTYTKEKSGIYVFYSTNRTREFINAFYDAGLKQRSIIVWHKTGGGFGDFMAQYMNAYEPCIYGSNGQTVNWYGASNEKTVWECDKKKCDLHPTMKPVELVARAIRNSSQKNNSVLDLFGGSGSTLIACEQLNRICYTSEIDEHYCDIILQRWETLTGQEAVLLERNEKEDMEIKD